MNPQRGLWGRCRQVAKPFSFCKNFKEQMKLTNFSFFANMSNMSLQARAQMMMEMMTSKNEGVFSHT